MALKPKDMRRKIDTSLKGEPEAGQIRLIDGFLRESSVHRALAHRTGARVWAASSGQPGGTVSVDHLPSDGDVVELQTRRDTPGPR